MNFKMTLNQKATQDRILVLMPIILATCVAFTITLDLLDSKFQQTSFYIFESLIFSSFWWIFIPLLYAQFTFAKVYKTKAATTLLLSIPIIAHLFTYPAIIWLISTIFYHHTFFYWQTFTYELTEYGFVILMAYCVPFVLYNSFNVKPKNEPTLSATTDTPAQSNLTPSLFVMDGNKRIALNTSDILYFSANSPYINIHHKQKRYLHSETLKSVSETLNKEVFVQVHKSAIVNIKKVQSYKSRLNGDYDLTMTDGTELRLSRNYASAFKQKFLRSHPDTAE